MMNATSSLIGASPMTYPGDGPKEHIMIHRLFSVILLSLTAMLPAARAQSDLLPPGDKTPLLQLDVGGPTAVVTALAFDKAGTTLYAAGLDKIVRVYTYQDGRFVRQKPYRVPLGPGVAGSINALAVSDDGNWLAVAGRQLMRGQSSVGQGIIVPDQLLPREMLLDGGNIYLINLRNDLGGKVLRGHCGEVQALTFLPGLTGKPPLLVSAGLERDEPRVKGSVRLWDVNEGKEVAVLRDMPSTRAFPGLAGWWHNEKGTRQVRIAIAWPEEPSSENPLPACSMRVWDPVAGKSKPTTWPKQGARLGPLADLGGGRFVTGYLKETAKRGLQGQLGLDHVTGKLGDPDLSVTSAVVEPKGNDPKTQVRYVPWAMTALSSRAGGQLDYVAVALAANQSGQPHQLELFRILDDGFRSQSRFSLRNSDPDRITRLAAVPGGKFLAVAGYRDNSTISIFSIDDLLRGDVDPARIRSPGIIFRNVAFVKKDDKLGLRLNTTPSQQPPTTGPVFDFAGRMLRNNPSGWKLDSPGKVSDDWQVLLPRPGDDNPKIRVKQDTDIKLEVPLKEGTMLQGWSLLPSETGGRNPVLAIATLVEKTGKTAITLYDVKSGDRIHELPGLNPKQTTTAMALLPAGKWEEKPREPILAVAHYHVESGESAITLYDLKSKRPFRLLNGHLQQIRGLAFSDSKPLLASVADDQTVCVYRLHDLTAVTVFIDGLLLWDRDGKVKVGAVAPGGAAAKAGLKVGDEILGVAARGDKPRRVENVQAFHLELDGRKPGSEVDVQVKGKEGVLTLPLVPVVGERKPRFTLFITQPSRSIFLPATHWIGWTPLGLFDASSGIAERLVGWQINTGNAAAPVSFAPLAVYRKEFYRRGLLDGLVNGGGPPPPPREEPELDATFEAEGGASGPDGEYVVRQKKAKLRLQIRNKDDYTPDQDDRATWEAVGPTGKNSQTVKEQRFTSVDGDWVADLDPLPWKPGQYRITTVYHSAKTGKTYPRELTLRYLPAPPLLKATFRYRSKGKDVVDVFQSDTMEERQLKPVDEKSLQVSFEIDAQKDADPDLEARLILQRGAERKPIETKRGKGTIAFEKKVDLLKGEQYLALRAGPLAALDESSAAEVSEIRVSIPCQPAKKEVKIEGFRIVPEGIPYILKGEEILVVERPTVIAEAVIVGTSRLTKIDWSVGEKTRSLLKKGTGNTQTIKVEETLEERIPTQLHLSVQADESDVAFRTVRVVFYRQLPDDAVGVNPANRVRTYVPKVDLTGKLDLPDPDLKFKASILVTSPAGKELPAKEVTITPTDNKNRVEWKATVPLEPGQSRLVLRIEDSVAKWRNRIVQLGTAIYLRRPEIQKPVPELTADSPLVDLKFTVQTPTESPPTQVRVEERVFDENQFTRKSLKELPGGFTEWEVLVKGVPANGMGQETRRESLTFVVVNRDKGEEVESEKATVKVTWKKIVPRDPAVVRFREFREGSTEGLKTHNGDFILHYTVTSKSPVKSVSVFRERPGEGKSNRVFLPSDTGKAVKDDGVYRLEGTCKVRLRPGENKLFLWVDNEGYGGSETPCPPITYVETPVVIRVTSVQKMGPTGNGVGALQLPRSEGEKVVFDPAESGLMLLKGEVVWKDPGATERKAAREVQVLVNGSRQFPVALDPAVAGKEDRRTFTVPIALTQKTGNEILFELPNMKREERSLSRFLIDCKNPWEKYRLHVLLVGIDIEDPIALRNNFFKALGATPPRGKVGSFKTKLFDPGTLYPILTGADLEAGQIRGQIFAIEQSIRQSRNSQHWVNDVILIYYQGAMETDAKGNRYLLTRKSQRYRNLPLNETALSLESLPRVPGVQLLLLNVTQKNGLDAKKLDAENAGLVAWIGLGEKQIGDVNPTFIALLGEAVSAAKTGRLGDVLEKMRQLIKQDPTQLVVSLPKILLFLPLATGS
jgi:WD40 repeat protein